MGRLHLRPSLLLAGLLALAGCSERLVENRAPLGGSCLACHEGITDVHPYFALSCVSCHGGNDQVDLPEGEVDVRDQALLRQSHVLPRDPTLWWANGVDDDEDGQVDEPGEFFDGRRLEPDRLAPGGALDQEINHDLDYLRFLNPGDLRVAQVGCGARSPNANEAMVCHAQVVYDVRRSMMSVQSGVPAGAEYGNAQDIEAADFGPDFEAQAGEEMDRRDPRLGRIGYTFNYDEIDDSFLLDKNAFDRDRLLAAARANLDPDDDDLMATQAPLFDTDGKKTRAGNELKHEDRAVDVVQYVPARPFPEPGSALERRLLAILGVDSLDEVELPVGVVNPVDNALRGFRAYHPLNWPGLNENFGFVDFAESPNAGDPEPPDPNDVVLNGNQNNPFGRARSTGCSACHVVYAKDGHNREPNDRTVADNGRQASTDLPFGMRPDLGQRFWPERHEIQRTVKTETCARCHAFVTRVDFQYEGKHENEEDDVLGVMQIGDFSFQTPAGTTVNVFDNLALWDQGVLVNEGEGQSEDDNGNGELDEGEDDNGNGALDLPDRVARSETLDGRAQRFVYGGANGSTKLVDVHFEAGMQCVDCHGIQDIHGDGNLYTRNWDTIEIECDDCHGTPYEKAKLVTSGPNGGRDLTQVRTVFGRPWLERTSEGAIVQHSRTEEGVAWVVPQLADEPSNELAGYVHTQPLESGPELGSRDYAHIAPAGEGGGLECYACHSAVQPNCMSCHYQQDVAKPVQQVWYTPGEVNDVAFQLFSYVRSPFLLGRSGDVEGNKISPYRSTMELFLSIAAGGDTLVHNFVTATKGGRSSVALNPYFPHVVRGRETKSCARCHTLVDESFRVQSDHLVTEASGQGSRRYQNVGDWAVAATGAGLELVDLKKETRGPRNVFPGFVFDATNVRRAELGLGGAADVALVRGASAVNGVADGADLALVAHGGGLSVVDVTGRDAPGFPPLEIGRLAELGALVSVDHPEAGAPQLRRAVVLSGAELAVVDFQQALARFPDVLDARGGDAGAPDLTAHVEVVGSLAHGLTGARRVRLDGTRALIASEAGVTAIDVSGADTGLEGDLGPPTAELFTLTTDAPALDLAARGRFVFVACGAGGVEIWDVLEQRRVASVLEGGAADSRGLTLWGTKLLVADGVNGLRVIDVAVPEDPILERTILTPTGGGADLSEASAVVVATVPIRTWALVADGSHGIRAVNLTPAEDWRTQIAANERSFRLSFERQDPFTPYDPTNTTTQVLTFPTSAPVTALARGIALDQLADGSGNRWRDGWLIGADALDEETVARMRNVYVEEVPGSVDGSGDGLGCVVRSGTPAQVSEDGKSCTSIGEVP